MEMKTAMRVWGALACFTQPETKPEPFSYDIITPSAGRNIADQIYRHPGMQWEVEEIGVCKPIQRAILMRNEVKHRASLSGFYAEDYRTQRRMSALYDVEYILKLRAVLDHDALTNPKKFGRDVANGFTEADVAAKIMTIFNRRLHSGQCFTRPFFGCREFVAHFGPVNGTKPIDISSDLGRMVFDLVYNTNDGPATSATGIFFPARIVHGVLTVPSELYKEHRSR